MYAIRACELLTECIIGRDFIENCVLKIIYPVHMKDCTVLTISDLVVSCSH